MAAAFRALIAGAALAVALTSATALGGPAVNRAPSWGELSGGDQQVLAPLSAEWDKLDTPRKQKWLGIAKRYPTMLPAEQERIQQQMRTWAQLTPAERQAARERYKSLKQLPPEKRAEVREKWQQYQQLPPEKREELAKRPPPPNAKPPSHSPAKSTPAPAAAPASSPK